MNNQLQEILDNLDNKTPRSRLAPYRKFILELRRRKYTYREILQILREKCQFYVSISTLHDFVRTQRKPERVISATAVSEHLKPQGAKPPERIQIQQSTLSTEIYPPAGTSDEIRQRIAALKQRATRPELEIKRFDYDPDQPLHLVSKVEKT